LVVHIEAGTYAKGVWAEGVEGNIWAKGDEVTGRWSKLHSEELNVLYCLKNFNA
jgi:hypothetical protein